MATGLSLVCGDCQLQLRSMKEAQDHAEISGHSNFAESTEPVLNLVCSTCGKPCRSKTEVDLHTKRTGHTEFQDKTAEAAKPLDLSAPSAAESSGAAGDSATAQASGETEMVVPQVNQELLQELQAMGFGLEKSTRALHFCGTENVEAAVSWIVEHEGDSDIDTMPLVPAADANKAKKKPLSPEEAKKLAAELAEKARKKREEEEREREKLREKERIRAGKELLEAKRIEEQQERKRIIELKRQEKLEEQRALDKIKARLEEDKAERRRKLGLPPKEAAAEESKGPQPMQVEKEEKKPFVPLRPASKGEAMRATLRGIKQKHKEEDERVKKCFQTLLTYIGNVVRAPDEDKYRTIRLSNAAFQDRVGALGGAAFLELCNFEKDASGETLQLPREKVDNMLLQVAGSELNSALTNPFFGVLL